MCEGIQIIVNCSGEIVTSDTSIDALIIRFKEMEKDLIVERNGWVVHTYEYASMMVAAGDEIEFINPHFGG